MALELVVFWHLYEAGSLIKGSWLLRQTYSLFFPSIDSLIVHRLLQLVVVVIFQGVFFVNSCLMRAIIRHLSSTCWLNRGLDALLRKYQIHSSTAMLMALQNFLLYAAWLVDIILAMVQITGPHPHIPLPLHLYHITSGNAVSVLFTVCAAVGLSAAAQHFTLKGSKSASLLNTKKKARLIIASIISMALLSTVTILQQRAQEESSSTSSSDLPSRTPSYVVPWKKANIPTNSIPPLSERPWLKGCLALFSSLPFSLSLSLSDIISSSWSQGWING